ncbi:hypothetical protein GCM10008026_02000 [Chelatococcus composti]|jgi:hypothetical protein|nr:hypothetical protein GCM10008026_02000 [Chelatococcus composti]
MPHKDKNRPRDALTTPPGCLATHPRALFRTAESPVRRRRDVRFNLVPERHIRQEMVPAQMGAPYIL